ncbi:MAG: FlgD immunoglobulin-like domain containing protein, partial [Candidatus Eisenbacteria bacterium]|nr:FlgD immunoglobulin-like domain containing protein [Candidatus Eisenbacteria bacterium]
YTVRNSSAASDVYKRQVSGWVKPTNATGGIQSILDNRDNVRGYHVALVGGQIVMNISTASGWSNYTSTAVLPNNVWTHFAFSNDRTNPSSLKVYINGSLDHTYDATNRNGDLTCTFPMSIGGHNFDPSFGYKGVIDELAVWDDALTADQVALLFQEGESGLSCPPDSGFTAGVIETTESGGGGGRSEQALSSFPNPFRGSSTLRFTAGVSGPVKVQILDVGGRVIREMDSSSSGPGPREVEWDGKTSTGERASAGIYFWRPVSGEIAPAQKMILLE